MWESDTYEAILSDALSRVTSDVDKREGSVIYDALAPACYKLAEYYAQLNHFADLVFGDTAVGEYLDRFVADYGIARKAAVASVRQVTASEAVTVGSRWAIDDVVYDITEELSENTYSATCETPGAVGNTFSGALSNIDNTSDAAVTLGGILLSGEDEEDDEALRKRFYGKVREPATSGNAAQYRQWALEVPGCGGAKVFPLWNGNGTVKVLVVDDDTMIDPSLPASVSDYIETVRPVGAAVTVDSPAGFRIAVSAAVKLDGSQTLAAVQAAFTAALTESFKNAVFTAYSVSYAKIGSLLLSTPGVADYDTLTVNGGMANLTIPGEGIPICGAVALSEVTK